MPGSRPSLWLRSTAIMSFLVVTVLMFSACSDRSPSAQSGTGPNPAPANGLVPQAFAEIPKPGSARPLDAPTSTPRTISQSYEVTAMPPGELMGYYVLRLPRLGWTPVSGPQSVGRLGAKSVWTRRHLRLEVITTGQDGLPSEASLAEGPTQLDLVLRRTDG